ncbi:hypothetical protein ACOMHN_067452 [Nucella lapillus]
MAILNRPDDLRCSPMKHCAGQAAYSPTAGTVYTVLLSFLGGRPSPSRAHFTLNTLTGTKVGERQTDRKKKKGDRHETSQQIGVCPRAE